MGRPERPPTRAWRTWTAFGTSYVVVLLALAWSWIASATTSIPAGAPLVAPADARLVIWILAWVAHAIAASPGQLFQANINHPARDQLAGSEHLLSSQLLFGPINALGGNAVLAANAVALASYPLAATCMAVLLLRFGCGRGVAWVMGLAFALGPLRVPGNLQVLQYPNYLLPAIVLALHSAHERPDLARGLALTAILTVTAFSSYYIALMAAVVAIMWVATDAVATPRNRRRYLAVTSAAAVFTVLSLACFSRPYFRANYAETPTRSFYSANARTMAREVIDSPGVTEIVRELSKQFGVLDPAMLAVPKFLARLSWILLRTVLVNWLGIAAIAAIALSCLAPFASVVSRRQRELRTRGFVLAAIGAAMAVGPFVAIGDDSIALPAWLLSLTSLRFFRVPFRFLVLFGFGLTLMAAVGLGSTLQRLRPVSARVVLAAFAALVLGSGRHLGGTSTDTILGGEVEIYRRVAATAQDLGPGPLLELPTEDAHRRSLVADAMVGSVNHWLPLAIGRTGYPCRHCPELAEDVALLPDQEALHRIVERSGARWVLLHPAQDWAIPSVRAKLLSSPILTEVWNDRGWTLAMLADASR